MIINKDEDFLDSKSFMKNIDKAKISAEYRDILLSRDPDSLGLLFTEILDSNEDSRAGVFSWHKFILTLFQIFGKDICSILSYFKTLNPMINIHLIRNGFYQSVDIYDKIALDKEYDLSIRRECAKFCDIDTLNILVEDSDSEIRSTVFDRLGPKYSLKYMYKDKDSSIRYQASILTPAKSKDINIFLEDVSKKVIANIIEKIDLEMVLFLVGNKKVTSDKKLAEKIKSRLYRNV